MASGHIGSISSSAYFFLWKINFLYLTFSVLLSIFGKVDYNRKGRKEWDETINATTAGVVKKG